MSPTAMFCGDVPEGCGHRLFTHPLVSKAVEALLLDPLHISEWNLLVGILVALEPHLTSRHDIPSYRGVETCCGYRKEAGGYYICE